MNDYVVERTSMEGAISAVTKDCGGIAEEKPPSVATVEAAKRKKSNDDPEVHKKLSARSSRLKEGVAVIDMVCGDAALAEHVSRAYVNEDDAPIFFDWNDTNLAVFWSKAVDYGAIQGADAPPAEINGGSHLTGEPTQDNVRALKHWILQYVSATVNIPGRRIRDPTDTYGLCGSSLQRLRALIFLVQLSFSEPWFVGVIENGNALPGPLATVYRPCTGSENPERGFVRIDASEFGCVLWA
jgi:hypothetical protein